MVMIMTMITLRDDLPLYKITGPQLYIIFESESLKIKVILRVSYY